MALKKSIYSKRFYLNLTLICVFVVEFGGIFKFKEAQMKPEYKFFANWGYAMAGILAMLKNEVAFRIELAFIVPAMILSFFLPVSMENHLILVGVLFIIIIAECLNSAVEACVDLVTSEFAPKAKIAKDCASAGVFFSVILAISSWAYTLYKLYETWQLV